MRAATQKVAFLGLCTAVALVLAYVELLLPPLFAAVPGIKLGLPNIVIVFILYRFGLRYAMIAHAGTHVVSKLIWILFI